jgi:signal transduction histidine kinase
VISVIDDGLGIPQDDLPRVFDTFFRVEREEHLEIEGTGLGLAIAKAIVEQHHGNLWVESELGNGSNFSLALPIYQPT